LNKNGRFAFWPWHTTMFPTICTIGPLTIYSYGLMMAVAVVVCAVLMAAEAPRYRLSPQMIYDLLFWTMISGIIGGRFFYVLLNLPFFLTYPGEIIMLHHGGLAWQGGLAGGTLGALGFIRRSRLNMRAMMDFTAPYIALGQAIGRIGCFLNGCCYGREVAWGVYFPVHHARLHPTQLYAAAALAAIFFLLKKFRRHSTVPGQVLAAYLMLASVQRFVIEYFRADHEMLRAGLSVFQMMAAAIFLTGLILNFFLVVRHKRDQARDAGAPAGRPGP